MNRRIKTILKFGYYLPSNIINRLIYLCNGISCGKGHETRGIICVKKSSEGGICIGKNVRINSSGSSNPIGSGTRTYFQTVNKGIIKIGDNTRLSNCALTAATSIVIGNYVRIGAGVKIYDTDFHSLNPIERTNVPELGQPKTKPIIIGDYVFIGAGSFILKGVTIGDCAVVGAGSVVTKNVPPREIWAGNPAKKVGMID